jgi:ketosteroid isomerase-like protein
MAHANVDLLRENDEAMASGDLAKFFSHYTDDVKVHARGKNRLAGDYAGLDQMQTLFGRFMEAVGDYGFENHAYFADDEHGIVLQHAKCLRDGKTFELDEVFVLHFRDGKISEMWYVPADQAAMDDWLA